MFELSLFNLLAVEVLHLLGTDDLCGLFSSNLLVKLIRERSLKVHTELIHIEMRTRPAVIASPVVFQAKLERLMLMWLPRLIRLLNRLVAKIQVKAISLHNFTLANILIELTLFEINVIVVGSRWLVALVETHTQALVLWNPPWL